MKKYRYAPPIASIHATSQWGTAGVVLEDEVVDYAPVCRWLVLLHPRRVNPSPTAKSQSLNPVSWEDAIRLIVVDQRENILQERD